MSQDSYDTNSESSGSSLILRDYSLDSNSSSSSTFLSRTGTVRKALTVFKNDQMASEQEKRSPERHHNSFDASSYRFSLDSISEYKAKRSFSTHLMRHTNRECNSMDSSSSEHTENRSSSISEAKDKKSFISLESNNYLNWIESVSGENLTVQPEIKDVDQKIGEWNSFWLNYNNARARYHHLNSHDDKTDDCSDVKSTCSTQKESLLNGERADVLLSMDEINEILKCCQKITDILQGAAKRVNKCEHCEEKRIIEPFCVHQVYIQQGGGAVKDDTPIGIKNKERSRSYGSFQDIEKQKKLLKPVFQSTNNCIQSFFNGTVGDILRKAINKRRDVFGSKDNESTTSQDSFL